MVSIATDFRKMIKRQDNTKFLIKTSNANLRGKPKKSLRSDSLKIESSKPYIVRKGKKQTMRMVSKGYDKTINTFYGNDEEYAEGVGEQTLANIGGSHKRLSRNIQNFAYYKHERKLIKGKKRAYTVVKNSAGGLDSKPLNVRRNRKKLSGHSGITVSRKFVSQAGKPRLASRIILSFQSKFTAVRIAAAVATSAVPILIIILVVVMISSAFSVCPIDAYSSKASQMYWDIGEWEAEYVEKHSDRDEETGEKDTWYEWPYLNYGGTTVDRGALLAYISAKYPFLEDERSDGSEEDLRKLYDDAITENFHDDIPGYIDLHRDELFEASEYNDYKLYLQDEYILYRCYGSPTVGYAWQDKISSHQGARLDPKSGKPGHHNGVDIACPIGTKVNSIMDAQVSKVNTVDNGERGIYVTTVFKVKRGVFRRDIEISVTYEHLSEVLVSEGQKVKRGDVIAISGNTGKSTGPHLHVEIKKNGEEPINPEIVCERNNIYS